MFKPTSGATIFDAAEAHGAAVIDSPVSPQSVARAITEVAQANAKAWRDHIAATPPQAPQGPWAPPLPPPVPVPVAWTIYNRWTGKSVCDLFGNEHSDPSRAVVFPSEAAALQFARSLRGKPVETALAQPPPDDPAHCYKCGTANAHGTVTCHRCHQTIEVATSWVQVHVYDARGRWAGPTIYV